MTEIPIKSNFQLGAGFDNATQATKRVAVNFDLPEPLPSQTSFAELVSIKSSKELTKTLDINASASFKKGVGGASAEYSLAKSYQFNRYYTYALMRIIVRNSPQLVQHPELTEEAEKYLSERGWEEFFQLYGDSFIEGFITGGSYYAMLEIQTTSEKEQEETKLKLSGYYGPVSASLELKQTFEEIQNTKIINIFLRQNGGWGDSLEITLGEMLEQAKEFPSLIKNNPVNAVAITAKYRERVVLPNIPAIDELPKINQRDVLEDLGNQYLNLRDYKANLEFILEHFSEFDDFRELETEELNVKKQAYQDSLELVLKEIDEVVSRAENCQNNYSQCPSYAPDINFLPLPTIGGEQLTIKQMEEQIATLRQQVESLTAGMATAQKTANAAQNTANTAVTKADAAQNTANDGVNRANNAQNTANKTGGFHKSGDLYVFPTSNGVIHLSPGGTCYYEGNARRWCHQS